MQQAAAEPPISTGAGLSADITMDILFPGVNEPCGAKYTLSNGAGFKAEEGSARLHFTNATCKPGTEDGNFIHLGSWVLEC
jgi:hypothetical protein